jgi:hypothetical protein
MKTKFLDAALGAALVLAIAATMLLFLAVRGPSVEVRDAALPWQTPCNVTSTCPPHIDPAREGAHI